MEKIKCYELDFGDTNLISPNLKDVIDWIESEVSSLKEGENELNYTINVRMLTQEEIDALPEWT